MKTGNCYKKKEDKISINLFIIIALCILTAILAAALVFLAALLFKHIRQVKKLNTVWVSLMRIMNKSQDSSVTSVHR